MNLDLLNPTSKVILKTVAFYVIAFGLVFIANKIIPSGPCTPGGILLIFFLPFISAALFIYNLVKRFNGHKPNIYSALIHFLFVIGFAFMIGVDW